MHDLSALEKQYGLPAGFLTAQMQTESGGNPNAKSPAGALGLFQFMPETAKEYGIDPLNPDQAAIGAARMDSDLIKKYNGDIPSALAAYNWGQGNVDRKGLDNAPPETQNYISRIMGALGNAIIPSANASEMPDLSHLSDDQLEQIAKTPKSALASLDQADSIGAQPWGNLPSSQAVETQQLPDLSHISDNELKSIASGNQAGGNPPANAEQGSPNGTQGNSDIGYNKQAPSGNPILDKLNSLVAETPEDNYFGLIPAGKGLARGALALMQDVSGHGQAPGSNLTPDELNAVMSISPTSEMALKGIPGISGSKAVVKAAEDTVPAIRVATPTAQAVKLSSSDPEALAQTVAQQKGDAGGVLNQMREEGAVFTPQRTQTILSNIKEALDKQEFIPELNPTTTAIVNRIDKIVAENGSLGLDQLDQYRRLLSRVGNKEDGYSAGVVRRAIGDAIDESMASHLVNGSTKAIDLLKQGKADYAQSSRLEDLSDIITRTGGDVKKTQKAIAAYLNRMKGNGGFTKQELAALKVASRPTTPEKLARALGSFGFDIGLHKNVVVPTITAATGIGAPLAIAGTLARPVADAIGRRGIDKALNTIAKRPKK